ncbi:ATP-binding protein [Myxococcaceae bacterium GXIMD 01537]
MDLVLFIGLQGAGKSSFFQERFAGTHAHISKDLWPKARHRERRQRRLIGEALDAGRSVVVDNTNPSADVRAPLIELGRRHGARIVGYYFESDVEACRERNALRPEAKRVPDVGLFATLKLLERPRYTEGFDALHYVRLLPGGGFSVTDWSEE